MLKLYWANISALCLHGVDFALSEYRQNRLSQIKHEQKKKQSLGAELLLMHAVKEIYPEHSFPLEINCNEHGKPALLNVPIHFSLSHSGDYVACVVSDSPVGIDIEQDFEEREEVSRRFFNSAEHAYIASAKDKSRAFTRIWTAKESALKQLGFGLSGGLKNVFVFDDFVLVEPDKNKLFLKQFSLEDLYFSVCTEQKQEKIQITKINLS